MRKPYFLAGPHNVLFVIGCIGCYLCINALFYQLFYDFDARILKIDTVCQQPLNNRCGYEYSVESKNGTIDKIHLQSNIFRDNELSVGNTIKKNKFSFEYQVNGKKVTWGFAGHYLAILLFSLLAFCVWRYLTLTTQLQNKSLD